MSEDTQKSVQNVDTQKVQNILKKIIIKENNNLKTKERNDAQMVKLIQDLIEEEVKCY